MSLHGFCPHLLEACAVVIRSLQFLGSDITPHYQTHSSLPLSSLLGTVPRAALVPWKLSFYFFYYIYISIFYIFSPCANLLLAAYCGDDIQRLSLFYWSK